MRNTLVSALAFGGPLAVLVGVTACGSTTALPSQSFPTDGGTDATVSNPQIDAGKHDTGPNGTPDAPIPIVPGGPVDAGLPTQPHGDGGCRGYQCQMDAACGGDASTTISGTIFDPAMTNPLFNVLAFVPLYDPSSPNSTMQAIDGGTTGLDSVSCASCDLLYSGNPVALGSSGTDGKFTITGAPSGKNIPVIVQVGKWRTHTVVPNVTACQDNDAGAIGLPTKGEPSDPVISLPQIAVSTGMADSLECLLLRVGLDPSEYVSGAGGTGHVHLYTGGGALQKEPTATAPASSSNLWDTVPHLQQYDITLLSCEGSETSGSNSANLEAYVNTGGRVFASHYHYSWFSNSPPVDWANLATWTAGSDSTTDDDIGGAIVTSLNVTGPVQTFEKGVKLQEWLRGVNALGTALPPDPEHQGAPNPPANGPNDLAIGQVRFNASVGPLNTASQPWVTADPATFLPADRDAGYPTTSYFSFNTPVNAVGVDGGAPPYCGRVVYSDLHVGGGLGTADTVDHSAIALPGDAGGAPGQQAPSGCHPGSGQLSPQEKALEFMLFDLSACVTPDKAPPWTPPPPVVEAGVPQ